jgi:anti-sigma factor RsiW
MSCAPYRALLSERLDGRIAATAERELLGHLALCRGCAAYDRDLDEMRRLLAAPRSAEPPADLDDAIFHQLAEDRSSLPGQLWRTLALLLPSPPALRALAGLGAAAAVVLLLLAGPLAGRPDRPDPAGPPPTWHRASLVTVWDDSAETVAAWVGPDGAEAPWPLEAARYQAVTPASGLPVVRMFLFEHIVVRG